MINDSSSANIYFNVVVRINDDYADLITHLKEMDTRALYLRIFEVSLSLGCSTPLWKVPIYVEQAKTTPMPADPYERMEFDAFRAWMVIYEQVMRDEGLVGTRPTFVLGAE